ncbi:hypothetical protein KFE25_000045 [Diacronema lutheri]|uniref:Nucleotide-diphospho-sugar transferase domain-containing protein n=1 Tax=Diacronema lutheri TaxID=2081491 RepID=A0A8J5XLJ2_DIALT|nr:hypothetical protein KFE25_000045 [Diacronema lutheri]
MAVATAGRAGAPLVQRLVIALAVLVAVGVVVSNARMVVHFMADQQATFVGGWSHAQWSPDEARSAADARKLESVASRVRAGGLKLIGRTRAQFLADLHTPLGPGVGTGASDELVLRMPLSALLAPEARLPPHAGGAAALPVAARWRREGTALVVPLGAAAPSVRRLPNSAFTPTVRVEAWEVTAAALRGQPHARPPTLDDALALARARASADGASAGPVIATFVNLKRFDFGLTWHSRCAKLGLRNVVIGALDPEAMALLQAHGVPTFQMGATAARAPLPGAHDYGWNSADFRKMGVEKVQLLADILERNQTVLLMDADAVLVADPLPYFARWPEADILVTTDYIGEPSTDGGIDRAALLRYTLNIGVIFARPSAAALAKGWLGRLSVGNLQWDQNVFYEMMASRQGGAGFADDVAPGRPGAALLTPAIRAKRLGLAWDGRLLAGVLPTSLFCTGFTFVSGYCEKNTLGRPFTFHACWLFYEALGKRARLRSLGLWHDSASYYERGEGDRTDGFLALADDGWLGTAEAAGSELLLPPHSVDEHMRLVHAQLALVRSGMVLAALLRRQFVMPRIVCLYDKWWAEHNGTIPAAKMDQPIKDCPQDHILDLQMLNGHQQWLPRQHTFLRHGDMPEAVRASRANVSLAEYSASDPLQLDALLKALAPAAAGAADSAGNRRVLSVSAIPDVYRMLSREDQDAFRAFAKRAASMMCCTWSPRLNGYIHYDFFWDVVPHTDSLGRTFTREWVPTYGNTKQRLSDCSYNFKAGKDASHPKVTCGLDSRPL